MAVSFSHFGSGSRIDEILQAAVTARKVGRCEEVGGMLRPREPSHWLSVAIRVAVDWRFLMALALLIRMLLNK